MHGRGEVVVPRDFFVVAFHGEDHSFDCVVRELVEELGGLVAEGGEESEDLYELLCDDLEELVAVFLESDSFLLDVLLDFLHFYVTFGPFSGCFFEFLVFVRFSLLLLWLVFCLV